MKTENHLLFVQLACRTNHDGGSETKISGSGFGLNVLGSSSNHPKLHGIRPGPQPWLRQRVGVFTVLIFSMHGAVASRCSYSFWRNCFKCVDDMKFGSFFYWRVPVVLRCYHGVATAFTLSADRWVAFPLSLTGFTLVASLILVIQQITYP